MQKLRKSPDDQGLNFAVGRYQCLVKEEWDQGVEALAKGEDAVVLAGGSAQADLHGDQGLWPRESRRPQQQTKFQWQARGARRAPARPRSHC